MTNAHYRLTSDEFLSINSQLSNAQLRVYLHYKTLDPFGDRRVEFRTKAIAKALGITQRTVQLALRKLSSMGLIIWEKAKSFVRSLGDLQIAKAITRSSRRSVDRDRQLELNLEAGSESSQSSSVFFNQINLEQEEIFEEQEQEKLGHLEEEISIEEAIAEIRKALPNDESLDENANLLDEDLQLNNEHEEPQGIEEILEPQSDLQLNNVGNANGTAEGKPTRAAVEQFVLKTLNKTFTSAAQRAAYFGKFDLKSWKKWEISYKASLVSQAPYKPYIPEKVEVAPPDSPVAKSAIAHIKAKLGIK